MQPTGSILIIDRDPTIAELLVEILTDAGYIADMAPDGAVGVLSLRQSGTYPFSCMRFSVRGAEKLHTQGSARTMLPFVPNLSRGRRKARC